MNHGPSASFKGVSGTRARTQEIIWGLMAGSPGAGAVTGHGGRVRSAKTPHLAPSRLRARGGRLPWCFSVVSVRSQCDPGILPRD